MPFNTSTGVYTAASGATSAFSGQVIASTTWNSIFTDLQTALSQLGESQCLNLSLAANQTGQDVNTAQTWFPGGGPTSLTLATGANYFIEGILAAVRTSGTNSHSIGLSFDGGAVLTSIAYMSMAAAADAATFQVVTAPNFTFYQTAANNTVWAVASTSANQTFSIYVRGMVRVTTGGTFTPNFTFSSAPGGAPSIQANTWFTARVVGI